MRDRATDLDHFHGNQDSQRDSRAAHDWNSTYRARVVLAQLHSVCTRHGVVVRQANDGSVSGRATRGLIFNIWCQRFLSLGFTHFEFSMIHILFQALIFFIQIKAQEVDFHRRTAVRVIRPE